MLEYKALLVDQKKRSLASIKKNFILSLYNCNIIFEKIYNQFFLIRK